ncbi:MAG: uroporphyrinogen-III synthase [Rhodospirillaceae bacterium]|nr:MAG: uroporphyrinogen-III synthase [Rhodospirillaceae bacterium]
MTGGTLQNIRIALAESRELDLLAQMLEREGAEIVRCPLVTIRDTPDAAGVVEWIHGLIAGKYADVIFYTGEGMRRLTGFATQAGLRAEFLAALGRVRKITRGPKPVRALREVGLAPDVMAEVPTTAGLMACLIDEDLRGRSIGLQIYGQEPNRELVNFLESREASVHIVAPYVYASESDDQQVESLIRHMADGRIAAILFTSSPQVQRLVEVAEKRGLADLLRSGLTRARVAAVGPIVAGELERHGFHADAVPESTFTMKPLVRAVAKLFQSGSPL